MSSKQRYKKAYKKNGITVNFELDICPECGADIYGIKMQRYGNWVKCEYECFGHHFWIKEIRQD